MRVAIAAFKDYLWYDVNSAEQLLKKIHAPPSTNLFKALLPVGYFKGTILKPLKKHKPDVYIILGMWNGKYVKIESMVNNKMLILKNPFIQFAVTVYGNILRLFGRSIRTKKFIPEEELKRIPINASGPTSFLLSTQPTRIGSIRLSKDAGDFVCNYALWVVEEYLRKNKLKTEFYFLHLPEYLTKQQEQMVLSFIARFL